MTARIIKLFPDQPAPRWHPNLRDEIEAMFDRLGGCHVLADLCDGPIPMLDHKSRLIQMRIDEASDPVWRAFISRTRERGRAKRASADPEYAAKRKAQMRASHERRKARMAKDPAFAEEQRRKWREAAARKKALAQTKTLGDA